MSDFNIRNEYYKMLSEEDEKFSSIIEKIRNYLIKIKGKLDIEDRKTLKEMEDTEDTVELINLIVELSNTDANNEQPQILEKLENIIDEL